MPYSIKCIIILCTINKEKNSTITLWQSINCNINSDFREVKIKKKEKVFNWLKIDEVECTFVKIKRDNECSMVNTSLEIYTILKISGKHNITYLNVFCCCRSIVYIFECFPLWTDVASTGTIFLFLIIYYFCLFKLMLFGFEIQL